MCIKYYRGEIMCVCVQKTIIIIELESRVRVGSNEKTVLIYKALKIK